MFKESSLNEMIFFFFHVIVRVLTMIKKLKKTLAIMFNGCFEALSILFYFNNHIIKCFHNILKKLSCKHIIKNLQH